MLLLVANFHVLFSLLLRPCHALVDKYNGVFNCTSFALSEFFLSCNQFFYLMCYINRQLKDL